MTAFVLTFWSAFLWIFRAGFLRTDIGISLEELVCSVEELVFSVEELALGLERVYGRSRRDLQNWIQLTFWDVRVELTQFPPQGSYRQR